VGVVRRAATIFVLSVVAAFLVYLGLLYVSATSAKYSISRINLLNVSDPVRAILSRQLDIDLYLSIEGCGPLSVPVKSLSGQVYLEDKYVGNIRSVEPFKIPASGTVTVHLTFHLDLSGISASDIQHIVDSVSSHGGEVKIGFDGIIEPVILFFPVTIPVSYQFYALTSSNAPEVIDLSWDTTAATVGETVGFHVTVRNIFRGSTIDGVLTLIVREDVALGFDVDAETFHFAVHLSPGESRTFSGSFKPYKRSSTRGFFLKAQWGDAILAEQENKYPPRLSVVEGALSLIDAYWTVGGSKVTRCNVGDEVTAHIVLKASEAPVEGTITVKIRKDLALMPDVDVKALKFEIFLRKDEVKEFTITFTPIEPSSIRLRGYFIEVEGDLSWTMPNTYPPRLIVGAGGIPLVVDAWWTTPAGIVTEVKKGEIVQAHVCIKASGGYLEGTVTVRVRKDLVLLPDEDYKTQNYEISLAEDEKTELIISFMASETTSLFFRGYFIQVDFVTWGTSWTMPNSYPPRLRVSS